MMMMMMMISKIKTVNKSEKYLPYKNAEPANFHSIYIQNAGPRKIQTYQGKYVHTYIYNLTQIESSITNSLHTRYLITEFPFYIIHTLNHSNKYF